ncbi:hypothetical protein A3218_02080 [Pseudomonas chlororaphis]|uniref:hypothetical protein n=1 Tax=Pseudomonas chlororaphis TaxID=587753 RepID=UPI000789C94A|nr:hypothetical protein [Pseudomonas chlororaphis]AMS13159.1 hypothetical protein A3218_02080 [Pseudomonas chlororaphis]
MEVVQVTNAVLGWGEIVKIVLASGVVAAFIGWAKDLLFKSRERKQEAVFAAIGLVAKLDLYVLQSRRNVWDYKDFTAQLTPERDYQDWPACSYPDLDIPDSTLKQLSRQHASDFAWIATDKALASQHLSAIHDAAWDPTEVHAHKADVVGYFGYEAYLLAGGSDGVSTTISQISSARGKKPKRKLPSRRVPSAHSIFDPCRLSTAQPSLGFLCLKFACSQDSPRENLDVDSRIVRRTETTPAARAP